MAGVKEGQWAWVLKDEQRGGEKFAEAGSESDQVEGGIPEQQNDNNVRFRAVIIFSQFIWMNRINNYFNHCE